MKRYNIKKQLAYYEISFLNNKNLNDLINEFNSLKKKFGRKWNLSIKLEDSYDSYESEPSYNSFCVYGERLETIKEAKKRIKEEEEYKALRKEQARARAKERIKAEKETYLRLRKKFEKKNLNLY